jgi:WD40 repeat protein
MCLGMGKMVVSGSSDKTVRIWNGESGETMHIFEGHEDWVRSVQFSPDSSRVVSGSLIRLCGYGRLRRASWHSSQSSAMAESSVFATRLAETGSLQGQTASKYGTLKQEVESSQLETRRSSRLPGLLTGHTSSGDVKGEVTIWNSHTGEQLRTWKAHDEWIRLSLSPSGSHLATSSWNDSTAFVFDVSTGEQITALKHSANVHGIAYSPSGKFIATGCDRQESLLVGGPSRRRSSSQGQFRFRRIHA